MRTRLRFRHGGFVLGLLGIAILVFKSQRSMVEVDEVTPSAYTRRKQFRMSNDLHPDLKIVASAPPIELSIDLHPDVMIVPSSPPVGVSLSPHECLSLPMSPKAGLQICVHPVQSDRAISKALTENRLWESELVLQMQKALQRDGRMLLLDIGCNIGVYTIWAAAMGNRVVAVDMLAINLHLLQMSLHLNHLSKHVTLINNAVYRDHRTLETLFFAKSLGASRLNTSKPFKHREDQSRSRVSVRTICLNDLVPLLKDQTIYLKMDIENTEHQALACADQLFKQVNIKVVQMEWHRRVPEESIPILNFMSGHGYVASLSSVQFSPVNLGTRTKNLDVFFLKRPAFH